MHHITKLNDITINFGRINQYVILIIVFFIALIVGISGSTDVYEKFNKLPDNRNELTPIKQMETSIINGSILFVRIKLNAITQMTLLNLYNNIYARVEFESISFSIRAANANSNSPQLNSFEFSYKLPAYGKNVSVQLFLVDTPINKIQFFDLVKDENDNDFQNSTSIDYNIFNNVCVNEGKLQTFFKGKPNYNMKNLKIPVFQNNHDFNSINQKWNVYSGKSTLIYNDPEQTEYDPFSITALIFNSFESNSGSNIFIYNSGKEEVFQNLFDIKKLYPEQTYCFSSLQIQNNNQIDSYHSLNAEIIAQLKKKDTSSKQVYETKPSITYIARNSSSIIDQNDLFQAICPECEINTIYPSSSGAINISDYYKIANSKIIIGFHSDLLVSSLSMVNTNSECVIIDIMPVGLRRCGWWIKNMKEVAKTIIYYTSNSNYMNFNNLCNNNYKDCKTSKCTSLLDGKFSISADKIIKAINMKSDDCPNNLIAIKEDDVFCINSEY